MCGIAAGQDSSCTLDQIEKSLESIRRRGPDASQIERINDSIFLGFNLLGLNSAKPHLLKQPLQNDDKSLSVCVNGEIYNHRSLKADLESRGHVFQTESDCEVVLKGLEIDGQKFLSRLNGEFAIVAYFKKTNSWLCAVDHVGTKPLKYFLSKEKFLIASSVRALRELGVNVKIDSENCLFALSNGSLPSGQALFSEIKTIPPGHCLEIKNGFESRMAPYEKKSQFEKFGSIEIAIENAVRNRVPEFFKPAVALSGGIDSSLIALILKDLKVEFSCFSINFLDSEYSEKIEIENFCRRHEISTTDISIQENDLIEMFAESILNSENIAINAHVAAKLILNKKISRAGHRVCFTGDGADELFFGYDHFHTEDEFQFVHDSQVIGARYLPLLASGFKFAGKDLLNDFGASEPTAQDLYYRYWLSEYGLKTLGDSQSANESIEYRYPFVDLDLMNQVKSLNLNKNDQFPSKKLLRKIVETKDPKLSQIPKRPFTAPLMTRAWMPLFDHYVLTEKFSKLELFNFPKLNEYVNRLHQHHVQGMPRASSILLSQILSLGILNQELCRD